MRQALVMQNLSTEINVARYCPGLKDAWDAFIDKAKNRHFIFFRDYMEYHADRFSDHSLLFYKDGELKAVLPANIRNKELISHGGLTFGGIISDITMTTPLMLTILGRLKEFLLGCGIEKLIYKAIPYIYHLVPAEEDRYALFLFNARLVRRDVTTTIYGDNRIKFQERRSRAIKKAKKNNIRVEQTNNFMNFWHILSEILDKKYGASPVHTLEEITNLSNLFPHNIKLFIATSNQSDVLAGVLIYENKAIAHVQYIASSDEGRETGALDLIFEYLLNEYYKDKKYFDFGTSNEKEGRFLNTGLIEHKEGFGARAVVHDFYEIKFMDS